MNPMQSAADMSQVTRSSSTLEVAAAARVVLSLLLAYGLALANPPSAQQAARTSFDRWESINYPRVRIPFEGAYSRSNMWINVSIRPAGTGFDVSVTGWTGTMQSSPPSIEGGRLVLRLHRPNGEIVESKPLNSGSALGVSHGGYVDYGFYYGFPGATNQLEEGWIELNASKQRYWFEIPYGFTQMPSNISTRPVFKGPPRFAPAMKERAPEDLLLAWREVRYNLGTIQNGWHLSLIALNAFEPETEIELSRDAVRAGESIFLWDLRGPPQTALSIRDRDGMIFKARCMGVRITDDGMRRLDAFKCFTCSEPDQRCWGTLTVEVDDKSYSVIVPSSLYKFGHNAAEPYNNARIHEWR